MIKLEKTSVDIVCAGILVYDIAYPQILALPSSGELIVTGQPVHQIGGSAANTSIALSRLGKSAGIIGVVGNDLLGNYLVKNLSKEHVDTSNIFISSELVTSQSVHILVQGDDRRFLHHFGANSDFTVEKLKVGLNRLEYKDTKKVFILGGYLLLKNLDVQELIALLRNMKKKKYFVMLDVAFDGKENELSDKIRAVLPYIDFFSPNSLESSILTGEVITLNQTKMFLDWGVKSVAITCGDQGVTYADSNNMIKLSAYPVKTVDGSGAGDAFMAGMAYGFSEGWEIVEVLKFAAVLGASVCRSLGCTTSLFSKKEALDAMSQIKQIE
jgi:sugar/nucleoside kinase (ribokinase family)